MATAAQVIYSYLDELDPPPLVIRANGSITLLDGRGLLALRRRYNIPLCGHQTNILATTGAADCFLAGCSHSYMPQVRRLRQILLERLQNAR